MTSKDTCIGGYNTSHPTVNSYSPAYYLTTHERVDALEQELEKMKKDIIHMKNVSREIMELKERTAALEYEAIFKEGERRRFGRGVNGEMG